MAKQKQPKKNFELVDRVVKEDDEKLTDEEREDLFIKLTMGKDATKEIESSKGKFIVKYPLPADHLRIGNLAAARRNFRPIEAFDYETETVNAMASTLDVVVVSGPAWYENAKKLKKSFTFLEVPSRAFIAELYGLAYSFRKEVEQILDEAQRPGNKRVPPKESVDDTVDSGSFGTFADKPDDK